MAIQKSFLVVIIFCFLGQASTNRQIKQIKRQINAIKKQNADMLELIEDKDAQIQSLQSTIEVLAANLESIKANDEGQDARIHNLESSDLSLVSNQVEMQRDLTAFNQSMEEAWYQFGSWSEWSQCTDVNVTRGQHIRIRTRQKQCDHGKCVEFNDRGLAMLQVLEEDSNYCQMNQSAGIIGFNAGLIEEFC